MKVLTNELGGAPTSGDPAADWMAELARLTTDAALPDPQVIWWKAQAFRRIDQEHRAAMALDTAERIQLACTLLAAIALLVALAATVSSPAPVVIFTLAVSMAIVLPTVFYAIRNARFRMHES